MSNVSSNGNPRVNPIPLEIPTAIPIEVRGQALKFAHFTDKVMGRLDPQRRPPVPAMPAGDSALPGSPTDLRHHPRG